MEFLEKLENSHHNAQLLNALQNRRDMLREQLQTLKRQSYDIDKDWDGENDPDKESYRNLADILDTYRLLGVSIVDTNEACLTLRVDCLYKDQYPALESHCFQLVKKGDNYTLGQHNLPPFVPVKQIEAKYLAGGVDQFVTEIRNYLYAYVRRRGYLQEIQNIYVDRLQQEVTVDLPVTFVTLILRVDNSLPDVKLQLQYDLLQCLPHSVKVDFVEDADADGPIKTPVSSKVKNKRDRLVTKWRKCLTEMDIVTAFSKLLP